MENIKEVEARRAKILLKNGKSGVDGVRCKIKNGCEAAVEWICRICRAVLKSGHVSIYDWIRAMIVPAHKEKGSTVELVEVLQRGKSS